MKNDNQINEEQIKIALDFFKKKDYKSAIEEFKDIENFDKVPAILNNIGLCHMNLSENEVAEKYFLDALKLAPETIETTINLADLYYKEGRIENCMGILETTLTLVPENTVLMHYLARVYKDDYRYDMALEMLNNILDISPDNIDAYWDLGVLLYNMGDYDNAIASLEHVVEKREDNPYIFYQMGLAYEAAYNVDKALSNYLKAISINPQFAPAYKKAGIMFMGQHDNEGAIEYFSDYLKFKHIPDDEKADIQNLINNLSK